MSSESRIVGNVMASRPTTYFTSGAYWVMILSRVVALRRIVYSVHRSCVLIATELLLGCRVLGVGGRERDAGNVFSPLREDGSPWRRGAGGRPEGELESGKSRGEGDRPLPASPRPRVARRAQLPRPTPHPTISEVGSQSAGRDPGCS